jgi:hypothetical protein
MEDSHNLDYDLLFELCKDVPDLLDVLATARAGNQSEARFLIPSLMLKLVPGLWFCSPSGQDLTLFHKIQKKACQRI